MILIVSQLACRPPTETNSETSVRFELRDGALDWGEVPWPSDLYRGDDGHLALGALPIADTLAPVVRPLLEMRTGFCTTCAQAFVIDGGLDPSSVPEGVSTLDDPVVLVDLETGEPVPLDVQWADGRLTVRPAPGSVLVARRRYAVAVTDAILGVDHLPLSPSPSFDLVRRGAPGANARAVGLLSPAFDVLDPARVVGLGVFETSDPGLELRSVRSQVRAWSFAPPRADAAWSGAALDDLLGVPGQSGPGIDLSPDVGWAGTSSIAHDTTSIVVAGTFRAPRFVAGSGVEVGALVRNQTGGVIAASEHEVPFVLIVPKGVPLDAMPVVVAHHGFNASRTTGFALADTTGRAGFAVLAIDAYQHGARAASAIDSQHAMRGIADAPDGFFETSSFDVSGRVFGLLGVPSESALSPAYPLAAFTQFAADTLAAVALVQDGDWSSVALADPLLSGLAFDPTRIAFVGNSMGAVVGTSVLAVEPEIGVAALNVLPGGIIDTLTESGEFRTLVDAVLLPVLGVERSADESAESLALDPAIDLFRLLLEPVDPLALAPLLAGREDLLVQLAGHDEVAAPRPSEAAVAAMRLPGVGAFSLAPVLPATLPARRASIRYEGAMHGMLEVHTQTSVWAEPLIPPLASRPVALSIENPIQDVHADLEQFLRSFAETGEASIP